MSAAYKTYTAAYFVQGKLLGISTFSAPFVPRSLAYFCATCGEIWGRVHVEQGEQEPYWDLAHCPCVNHKNRGVLDWSSIPGSLLTGRSENTKGHIPVTDWARAIEHLPPEVLRREFDINLKWYDNKDKDD